MQTTDLSGTLALLPIVDWLALGVLALALAMGAWRGLLYGVISVCGWIAAFLAAGHLGGVVGAMLPLDADERLRTAAGAAIVFAIVLFASGATAHLVRRLAAAVGMRPVDRILGAAFGALQALLLGLIVVIMLGSTPVAALPAWKEAHSVRLLQQVWEQLAPMLPALPQPDAAPQGDGEGALLPTTKAAPASGAASAASRPASAPARPGTRRAPEALPAPLQPVEVSGER